ncbi:hypothetical protein Q8A67_023183 [Cirrhinus molitorella]|uniref:Uncharacterized protein n=1 Tax=Cirrhinus molitorella TaxID=172907 RepID=A0AA88NZI7_9TELE|nr:hypothetical protein Q8A67_023183 [Cirrhinus molitorella]
MIEGFTAVRQHDIRPRATLTPIQHLKNSQKMERDREWRARTIRPSRLNGASAATPEMDGQVRRTGAANSARSTLASLQPAAAAGLVRDLEESEAESRSGSGSDQLLGPQAPPALNIPGTSSSN